jgi:hypothetical protein
MEAMMEVQAPAKPRRGKPGKPQVRVAVPKVKATLLLSAEASQRLSVHAAMLGEDRSALVDRLIMEHLRRYRVQDLGGTDRAKPDGTVIGGDPAA